MSDQDEGLAAGVPTGPHADGSAAPDADGSAGPHPDADGGGSAGPSADAGAGSGVGGCAGSSHPVVRALAEAVDGLLGLELTPLARDELLAVLTGVERQSRRLAAVDHRLIGQISGRGIGLELGYGPTASLLQDLCVLTARQANARVEAADRLGPRRGLTGQPLPPLYPHAAAAVAAGEISGGHAELIAATITGLPAQVRAVHGEAVERALTGQARLLDTRRLAILARRIGDTLDPDGRLTPDRVQQRDRWAALTRNPDGSADLRARLTPGCAALWETILTPLSAKRPDDGTGPDTRTPGQRVHDALEEAATRLLAHADLPSTAGVPTTLIITFTLADLEARTGQATTHHGGTLTVAEALRLAAEARVIPVLLSDTGGVLAYGRGRRLAPPRLRLALFARDKGCTFPGCALTAARSEVHHLTDWAANGPTDLANLTITCGYHNRRATGQGWRAIMINDVPHWIPPRHLDPHQTPRRNTLHHPWPPPTPEPAPTPASAPESETSEPAMTPDRR